MEVTVHMRDKFSMNVRSKFRQLALVTALVAATSSAMAADRKIMILQSLTGVASFVGVPAVNAMKLLVEELNAKKVFGADRLVIEVADSASARAQAVAAVTRAAADPEILAIMGPTTAVEAIPAASIANDAKIPMMSFGIALGILKPGPWSFIANQPPQITMPQLGDYVLDKVKPKSCATIRYSDNEAYVDLERIFVEYTEPKGIKYIERTGVKQADSDFSAIATRIVATKPDCVILFTLAPSAANLVIQLKQAGLPASTRLIGQTGLSSSSLVSIGGAAVEGIVFNSDWVPGGSSAEGRAFAANYKKATGTDADSLAAGGYSHLMVLATAIKNASPNPTREKIRDALTHTKDVPVVVGSGRYSFKDDRIPVFGSNILQVKNGQFVAAP